MIVRSLPMDRMCCVILLTAFCATMPIRSFADDGLPDALQRCSLIGDTSVRLDCYDVLSGRKSPATSESPEEALERQTIEQDVVDANAQDRLAVDRKVPNEEVAAKKTLDDLGSETLPMGARGSVEKIEVRATVARCEKDPRKKYLFHFENGQIWKQKSNQRLYFKDCNFDVTITQDFFGYKMQADGEKRQIRISRVK